MDEIFVPQSLDLDNIVDKTYIDRSIHIKNVVA